MRRSEAGVQRAAGVVGEEARLRRLDLFAPNPWNPNTMTPDEFEQLCETLRVNGWARSDALLVWGTNEDGRVQNLIINGEHRWRAAREVGMAVGPVVEMNGITRAEAVAWTIRLDKIRGSFDPTKLRLTLGRELDFRNRDDAFALSLGFGEREARDLRVQIPALGGRAPGTRGDGEEVEAEAEEVDVEGLRAPFPWFGGKSKAAGLIWGAIGADVPNYVEPFAGSLAVLLARPGGPGKIETVNDLDPWIANFWRAVVADPEGVAEACDWPVNEVDLHARHKWLLKQGEWRRAMLDDPDRYDAKIAGWWVWGVCAWIGSGWCSPGEPSEKLPSLGSGALRGIHAQRVAGPSEQLPGQARGADRGVHSLRVAGPSEKLPHLGNKGRGVHRAPSEQLPHLSTPGCGVHRTLPSEQLPHLGNAGRGGHRDLTPSEQLPRLGGSGMDAGRGVHSGTIAENIAATMRALRDRLRRVRVACGDWERVLTPAVTTGHGMTGVLLDPPYAEGTDDLYGHHDKGVSRRVREWAIEHGADPFLRIVFCGYAGEHERFPAGWRCVSWKARGGYGSGNGNPYRERLWLSPHCLAPTDGE